MKPITPEVYRQWYKDMLLWRYFEDECRSLYLKQKIRGFLHLYNGQEAVAAGIAHAMDLTQDHLITAYRCHTLGLALGIPAQNIMAELMGKVGGTSKGMGGSMHIFSKAHRFYGGHGIVGGQIPLGAGIAMADQYFKRSGVTITLMGDGAVRQGVLHETFNMAMNWKLPVVFICENNQYAMGTSVERTANHEDIYKLGEGYEMPSKPVDGMNPVSVAQAVSEAIEYARSGQGPSFLDIRTYRFRGHSMSDAQTYRTKEEVEAHKSEDPILWVKKALIDNAWQTEDELIQWQQDTKTIIKDVVQWAESSPFPDEQQMYDMVYDQSNYPFISKT